LVINELRNELHNELHNEHHNEHHMNHNGNITTGEKIIPASDITFDSLLDETCERLLDRQVKYAVQRIADMEKRLNKLENELSEFLKSGMRK